MTFRWRFGSKAQIDDVDYPSASAYELDSALASPHKPRVAIFRYAKAFQPEPPSGWTSEEYQRNLNLTNEAKEQYDRLERYFLSLRERHPDIARKIVRLLRYPSICGAATRCAATRTKHAETSNARAATSCRGEQRTKVPRLSIPRARRF